MLTDEQIARMTPDKNCLRKTVRAADLKAALDEVKELRAEFDSQTLYYHEVIDKLKSENERLRKWAIEQFNEIINCHSDCEGCTDDEHKMFHIAEDAIKALNDGR